MFKKKTNYRGTKIWDPTSCSLIYYTLKQTISFSSHQRFPFILFFCSYYKIDFEIPVNYNRFSHTPYLLYL